MKQNLILLFVYFSLSHHLSHGQGIKWPDGKKAAIVLTYDDALASQLEIAIPQLDKANLKGTFFLSEPKWEKHITQWGKASKNGHELANHTLYHPCLNKAFKANSRYHSENYSVEDIIREISTMNKILFAIDGKTTRTYAYPCGETSVGGKSYVDSLKRSGMVSYARAVGGAIVTDKKHLDPMQVPSFVFVNTSASVLIDSVKSVQLNNGMAVFVFHGVGGDYLQVSAETHQQLINYLHKNRSDIWVATFEEAMNYITKSDK